MEYTARSSDPVYYAGTVLAALDRYLLANSSSSARLSGFVLGLTALGRLVMRLPKEVAEDEVERFAAILYKVRVHFPGFELTSGFQRSECACA
jgi:hypothetical protein